MPSRHVAGMVWK